MPFVVHYTHDAVCHNQGGKSFVPDVDRREGSRTLDAPLNKRQTHTEKQEQKQKYT